MGMIVCSLSFDGILPVSRDVRHNIRSAGANCFLHSFNNLEGILSGPGAE